MNTAIRYWEYYDMKETFDNLYESSQNNEISPNLYDLIISEKNILLAYRTIKSNKGSQTAGVDSFTIDNYKPMDKAAFITLVQNSLMNYKPKAVKRVLIPKPNGDKRLLGIPTMFDRLIQQMIKQIIEPICEAKFYEHSYGFRPLRGTRHAIPNRSLEYCDNRISRYSMVKGKCEILKEFLMASSVHCHHFIPKKQGGTDKYANLRIIHKDIHRLIHAETTQTIDYYLNKYALTSEQVNRVNHYRRACNLKEIIQ
ncbi:HNH endonuclease [Listeria monocytogenes]|nr:HNH endonuclease [Listeria monocytogenes]